MTKIWLYFYFLKLGKTSYIYLILFYRYKHDTDHTMYQLNIFHGLTDKPLGVINWFAVHPTSMNNTNHLISGDNKGLASQLLERYVNKNNRNVGFIYNLPNNPLRYMNIGIISRLSFEATLVPSFIFFLSSFFLPETFFLTSNILWFIDLEECYMCIYLVQSLQFDSAQLSLTQLDSVRFSLIQFNSAQLAGLRSI